MHSLKSQLADTWRSRALLALMAGREIRSRFAGTVLGLVWVYIPPVLTVAAYYLVFDVVLQARLPETAPTQRVGTYLIVGLLPWMAFSDALARGMSSLVESGGLLQKNALAPVLFPARAVVASAITYLPPILVVFLGLGLFGKSNAAILALPLLIAAQVVLAFLLGYIFAIFAAAMRDVLQVVGFAITLGVFLSPVLFSPAMIPESFRWLLWLNPMTPLILAYHSVVLSAKMPDAHIWLGIFAWLAASGLVLDRLIRRSREHLVDWL